MDTVVLERETTSAPAKRRLRFGRKPLALAGLALAIILGGIGYGRYWWTTGRFIESTDDAYVGGNVTALSPHVAGFVSQILVGDNQFVKAGQLVITLDDRDYKAALAHAEAVVQNQTAALANLHAKYTLQQSMIEQAQAQLAANQAEAGWARADAARYHALALTTFGTVQNDQKAFAADRKATAAVRAGEANLDAAKQQLAVIDTEIGETQASLAMAQADLRTAQLNLGYTQIRSPIDGYVGNRAAQVGAYVARDAYLVSVIPAHGLWVDANFKEDQLARYAARPTGDGRRRRAAGQDLPRPCSEPGAGHGGGVQRDPAGECHRQLHQDRAAGAGTHRAR